MSHPVEPSDEPARRAASDSASHPPKQRGAEDPVLPGTDGALFADESESFLETRMIPRIDWTSELGDGWLSAGQQGALSHQTGTEAGQASDSESEKESEDKPIDEIDQSDSAHLARNSMLMASGTLVSRVLGMVNGSLQTMVLGTAVAGDAFKAANTLPNFILVLLSAGVLNAVLLPQIAKAMKRPDGGQDFVDRLLTATFALIIAVAVVCTACAGLLMRVIASLTGSGLQLAIAFAFVCMPQVLFYGIFAVLGNLLNVRGRFGAYGWAPVANNVVAISGMIVFLSLWGSQEDTSSWTPEMIWVLAGSATLGIVVQALILIPPLYRSGFRWHLRWGLRGHGFGQVGRFASLTFLALLIGQCGGLLVLKMSTHISNVAYQNGFEAAGYMHYQNAFSLFQMPVSLISVSILTALFPQLARAWQRRSDPRVGFDDMREIVHRGLTLPALGIIPASALFIALATPAVRVIYVNLGASQARATALPLMIMSASMLGYSIVALQQQYCFATEQGKTNLWMQCLLTGIQVVFILLVFVVPLRYGVVVICLGMFVGNTTVAIVFVNYARIQIGGLQLGSVLALYLRLIIASGIAGLAARGVYSLVIAFGGAPAVLGGATTWIWQFGGGALGGIVFIAVLIFGAKILQIHQFFALLNPILGKLHLPQISDS